MGLIEQYLLIINIIGFLFYSLSIKKSYLTSIAMICGLIGGSVGYILAFLLLYTRNKKRHYSDFIILIIHSCYLGIWYFNFYKYYSWDIENCLSSLNIIYFLLINSLTFVLFWLDKKKAIKRKWRIREFTLLFACLMGGSIGGMVAMHLFHHKTKVWYFYYLIPWMSLFQLTALSLFLLIM
ncbi:MAG: DUF1294 domain-containing protein [Erysipelotrichaceae bacterium]